MKHRAQIRAICIKAIGTLAERAGISITYHKEKTFPNLLFLRFGFIQNPEACEFTAISASVEEIASLLSTALRLECKMRPQLISEVCSPEPNPFALTFYQVPVPVKHRRFIAQLAVTR